LNTEGDLVGMFEDAFYQSKEMKVKKGDKILLYTDGLLENKNSEKLWSTEYPKLLPVTKKLKDIDIEELPIKLIEQMVGDVSQLDDDIIVFVIEV